MSYVTAVKKYDEVKTEVKKRTSYCCAARGCPNAAAIDDGGEANPGKCYQHWKETDFTKWPAITQKICENFDEFRNWGKFSDERQAKHREIAREQMGLTNHKPTGLQGASMPGSST